MANNLEKRAFNLIRAALGDGVEIEVEASWLFGRPDIYLPDFKCAIFIDGLFWHPHSGGEKMRRVALKFLAEGNDERALFWSEKANVNDKRDREVSRELRTRGYIVIRMKEEKIRQPWAKALPYVSRSLARALMQAAEERVTRKKKEGG